MTTEEWIQQYNILNSSFKKRLVFRLGIDSGFFSEYNNMVLAMLYCLKHRIRFELHSDYTYFAFRDGWNDFFVPFGAVNTHRIHKDYNLRPYIIELSKEAKLQKIVKYRYIATLYKLLFGVNYMTQDLWSRHRDLAFAQETFDIPELGFHHTPLLVATQQVIKAFWRYNAQSAPIVAAFVNSVQLPEDYVSMHVRVGDKFTETKMFDFSEYMIPAAEFSPNKEAFVLTDDYTVIEQLQEQYPQWQFHTLCAPSERGYFHRDFVKQDNQFKYTQHLKLFANMDICASSTKFIGTYSSNPGMYMGMRIGPARCYCLDYDEWLIW
ncbi:hypothetical protein [Hymenobacter sp.]|jgi:hypothetical protein|uniref:hypothetical protein n=1 Tax=Hymenobacter sp. TaxID=1898978 RepID=UPI002ED9236A